jgi:hypothetical protein
VSAAQLGLLGGKFLQVAVQRDAARMRPRHQTFSYLIDRGVTRAWSPAYKEAGVDRGGRAKGDGVKGSA